MIWVDGSGRRRLKRHGSARWPIALVRARRRGYLVCGRRQPRNSPTVDEAGLPGFHVSVWHALWVPNGTPAVIVNRINAALVETMEDPAIRKRCFPGVAGATKGRDREVRRTRVEGPRLL